MPLNVNEDEYHSKQLMKHGYSLYNSGRYTVNRVDTPETRCPRCSHFLYVHFDDADYLRNGCTHDDCNCLMGLPTAAYDE